MKFETKKHQDGHYELWCEGHYWDHFTDLQDLVGTVYTLLQMTENPMVSDFVGGLINADVVPNPKP